ncbi:39S ribosomal protein L10, mitochondrial [Phlebotomus papatasi]|uniref:39S ribosomal protein L10, mitochondrial n=1 Tax=Phlebotomus papatasi TaxID=29031 RepID=UPI0024842DC1|nr:39S ribosomal protein L10, mitochondrial [Phlebotomus papatasi]
MASIYAKIFLEAQTPLVLARRFRGKINIQRPRKPHYTRALVEAVTQPIYEKPVLSLEACKKKKAKSEETEINPYSEIIAKEILNWFNHSRCTAIYHLNSVNAEDWFNAKVLFHRLNMHLKAYPKQAITLALSGSKYEEILPVFDARCALVFSPDGQPSKLMKISKKVPQIILIGAIAEDRILNRNQFVEYAALPSIDIVRAQLVSVLQSAAGDLVGNMEGHQANIVRMLETYAKKPEE